MIDPSETSLPPILLRPKKQGDSQSPHVPAVERVHQPARSCVLEVEGSKEVFYRGTYVTCIPLRGADIVVGRRDVMVGHYPDVDLAMYRKQDPSISRRHLRVYHDVNNIWFVEDLCNHNTTFFNNFDTPLNHERRELKHGDKIYVSNSIVFIFKVLS